MKFELRDWDLKFASSLVTFANNQKIAQNLKATFPFPYTLEDAHIYILKCKNQFKKKHLKKAIVIDDSVVGSISFIIQDNDNSRSGELVFLLGEPFWSKGITTQAIKEICEYTFSYLDVIRIYARPCADNMRARRVLEKTGFELEGIFKNSIYKKNKIYDSCMYAILKLK